MNTVDRLHLTGAIDARLFHTLAVLLILSTGCNLLSKTMADREDENMLLFKNGFEGKTAIVEHAPGKFRFAGGDGANTNSNWSTIATDTEGRLYGGSLNYNQGSRTYREATIVQDPTNPANQVVRFWGIATPESPKFRIQTDFGSPVNKGLKEFTCAVRLYVPQSMAALRNYPKAIDWLTVAEFWNDPAWTSREETEHAFRITVGIGKLEGAGQDLFFRISTDDFAHTGTGKNRKYRQIHLEVIKATHFSIPFGKWMTLQYHFRDGAYPEDSATTDGLFEMTATTSSGESHTICTLKSIMHSPSNPEPKGVTYWAPMKMYTSKAVASWMQSHSQGLELFYDDLAIFTGPGHIGD